MRSVRDLHDEAMRIAVDAQRAHDAGNIELEQELATKAGKLEEQAATQLRADISEEPTRAILFCSAASLAWQSGDILWCKRLCYDGLRGFPPPEYEDDFNELLERATIADHLDIHNIELCPGEFQLSLTGAVAAAGIIPIAELTARISHLSSILMQRIRLCLGKPFTDLRKKISPTDDFITYAHAFRPGSFALTMGVTRPANKQPLIPMQGVDVDPSFVVDNVLYDMELLSNGSMSTLEERIGNNPYLVHFLAHAKEIAPDGKRIRMVGLTRNKKRVSFQLLRSEFKDIKSNYLDGSEANMETFVGLLTMADMDKGMLRLTTPNSSPLKIRVKEGLEDIARNYFGKNVKATGAFSGTIFVMSSIDPTDETDNV